MRALKEKISLLEEQQRQRYASAHQLLPSGVSRPSGSTQACTAFPTSAKSFAKAGGPSFQAPVAAAQGVGKAGTAAAAAAAASRAAEQLRTFVLAHVIAEEWRLKPLLMAVRERGENRSRSQQKYIIPRSDVEEEIYLVYDTITERRAVLCR